jgi:hypothetical protein
MSGGKTVMKPLITKCIEAYQIKLDDDFKDGEESTGFLGEHFPEVIAGLDQDIVFQS